MNESAILFKITHAGLIPNQAKTILEDQIEQRIFCTAELILKFVERGILVLEDFEFFATSILNLKGSSHLQKFPIVAKYIKKHDSKD